MSMISESSFALTFKLNAFVISDSVFRQVYWKDQMVFLGNEGS